MSTVLTDPSPSPPAADTEIHTLADLLHRLGDIPLHRVRLCPPHWDGAPADLPANKMCELTDGTLVEKAMGASESGLAMFLGHLLQLFVLPRTSARFSGPMARWRS